MKEILYFTAPWCKSCANLKPHIRRLEEAGIAVQTIDVSVDPSTAEENDVMQLPTVILLQDEAVISRRSGYSESLVQEIYTFSKSYGETPMQEYTRSIQTVTAWQTPWPMTITVNGKTITGNAGEWLVIPPNGAEPYFMGDIQFTQQFNTVPAV